MSVVRSDWESSIATFIRNRYPSLRVETNNRNIIPSRNKRSSYFEIDIFIPELRLGIEANGERYHNRQAYQDDKRYGTQHSDEMYKEAYCNRVGIHLIHVWSSDSMELIQRRIDRVIQQRLADPTLEAWRPSVDYGAGCAKALPALLVGACILLQFAILVNGRIQEVRQEKRTEREWRESEAAARLQAQEDEVRYRKEEQLRKYEWEYETWVLQYNQMVNFYNEGRPPSQLKLYADDVVKQIEEFPLSDVPESRRSEHGELLSTVREFGSRLE